MSFRLDSIAELARQMAFTPAETLGGQVARAEDLLHEVDAGRAYPLEFVIFRITGFNPKSKKRAVASDLLTGLALQHDLGLLIEQTSDRLRLVSAAAGEPVLSIDDVTEQFNITSKTVQRWRRRGLPARRFLFADGKRRVGFLLSSVERFVRSHREQVIDDKPNISRVELDERERMLRMARRLCGLERAAHEVSGERVEKPGTLKSAGKPLASCEVLWDGNRRSHATGLWEDEIARRIARRLRRSPLTVLHTIRQHDQANPQAAIFPHAAKPIGEKTRTKILRRHRRGWSLGRLARRIGRSRAAVYRVILDERIAGLQKRKIRFIDDPLYHQDDAADVIESIVAAAESAMPIGERGDEARLAGARPEDRRRLARDLPGPLQSLCRTAPLGPVRERALFLKLNFHKFQFAQARRRLDPQFARRRDLAELERLLQQVNWVRNDLVTANLRLVVSTARKHLRPGQRSDSRLMELVSDGHLTLMRAVDGFDVNRGYRFSTYATLALMKGFARSSAANSAANDGVPGSRVPLDELVDRRHPAADIATMRDEVDFLIQRLDESERRIVDARFGLSGVDERAKAVTSRAQAMERAVMSKLRAVALEMN